MNDLNLSKTDDIGDDVDRNKGTDNIDGSELEVESMKSHEVVMKLNFHT